MPLEDDFSDIIKKARTGLKLSVADVAKLTGLPGADITPSCRLCGAPLRHTVVDLGMSPPCEKIVMAHEIDEAEAYFPLHVMVCEDCLLVQLREYVRPEAIEIRRGVVRIRHTIVPMVRVQHVDTTSGLLEQAFDLYSVEIHTAADSHKIPLLEARDADEVRRRIEALTDES